MSPYKKLVGQETHGYRLHLPPQLYDAVLDAVRRGLAVSVSEFIRYAVIDMLLDGEYCPPPPLPLEPPPVTVIYKLTPWAIERLKELVYNGVYRTMSDAVRAALWRAVNGAKCKSGPPPPRETECGGVKLPAERPAVQRTSSQPPPTSNAASASQEEEVFLSASEVKWDEETWRRIAPCVKTLLMRIPKRENPDVWTTYYLVDVQCVKARGVELKNLL